MSQVSQSLGKSRRIIWRAIQFARKYPSLDMLPKEENINWHKICNKLLPEQRKVNEWLRSFDVWNFASIDTRYGVEEMTREI